MAKTRLQRIDDGFRVFDGDKTELLIVPVDGRVIIVSGLATSGAGVNVDPAHFEIISSEKELRDLLANASVAEHDINEIVGKVFV